MARRAQTCPIDRSAVGPVFKAARAAALLGRAQAWGDFLRSDCRIGLAVRAGGARAR